MLSLSVLSSVNACKFENKFELELSIFLISVKFEDEFA